MEKRKETIEQKLTKITNLVSKMKETKETCLLLTKEYNDPSSNMIGKKTFLGIEVGDIIPLNEFNDSYAVCIFEDTTNLKFVVVARKYSVVSVHSHDFKESIRMMEGRIREIVSHQILLPGQHLVLEPDTEHGFISEDFSIYSTKVYLVD